MPSKQTTNYQLNQWVKTDKVLMEDFNKDNEKIDEALKVLDVRVDGKADQSALEAEINARTSAISSINTALAARGNCRMEISTYTGTAASSDADYTTKSIRFSAKPAFFAIVGTHTIVFGGASMSKAYCVYHVDRADNGKLTSSWSGNTVTLSGDGRAVPNNKDVQYLMAAFYAQDA